jgi:hypothetical protein
MILAGFMIVGELVHPMVLEQGWKLFRVSLNLVEDEVFHP